LLLLQLLADCDREITTATFAVNVYLQTSANEEVTMTRTTAIGVRVEPHIKEAAKKAAADDHRTLASLLEKLLVEHLKAKGYLKK
jgi:hypothetical protein